MGFFCLREFYWTADLRKLGTKTERMVDTMAMFDWNGNGNNNDVADNFIEYQIYQEISGENEQSSYTPSRGNGMSTFGAVVSVIAGLVLQSALYVTLGIDVDDVPVIIILILWAVFSTIAAMVVDKIGI